jgi:hypothetical protein
MNRAMTLYYIQRVRLLLLFINQFLWDMSLGAAAFRPWTFSRQLAEVCYHDLMHYAPDKQEPRGSATDETKYSASKHVGRSHLLVGQLGQSQRFEPAALQAIETTNTQNLSDAHTQSK